MINVNKLLESKRIVVSFAETKIDKDFVKRFRADNHLTQVALANVLGVKKKTIEKWEQGVNSINGSSAVLLKLLNNNPELLNQLYSVKIVSGKIESEQYTPIASKSLQMKSRNSKPASIITVPIAAMFMC